MNDVSIPIGISVCVTLLDIVSTAVRNEAPRMIDAGTVFLASGPAIILAICGITSPTHPMIPLTATEDAVMRDAATIATALIAFVLTPRDSASSSGSESMFSLHEILHTGRRIF